MAFKKPQLSGTYHRTELLDTETGEISPSPYLAIDRPLLESKAWAALSCKAHEIYLPLRLKWWKATQGGKHEDSFTFTPKDCLNTGIRIDRKQLPKTLTEFESYGFLKIERMGQSAGRRNRITLCDDWLKWNMGVKHPYQVGVKPPQLSRGKTTPPHEAPFKIACEEEVLRNKEDNMYWDKCIKDAVQYSKLVGDPLVPETLHAVADMIRLVGRSRVNRIVWQIRQDGIVSSQEFWDKLIAASENSAQGEAMAQHG